MFPPVCSGEPTLSYDQWVGGENGEPIKKDINTIENKFVSKIETFVKQDKQEPAKEESKNPDDKVKELEAKLAELEAKLTQVTEENNNLKKELAELQ